MVTLPIALFDRVFDCELKSRIPMTGLVPAVLDVAVIAIVEEPSRLPTVLPVTSPTLKRPLPEPLDGAPKAMAVKQE
jgi:hypothetical protein